MAEEEAFLGRARRRYREIRSEGAERRLYRQRVRELRQQIRLTKTEERARREQRTLLKHREGSETPTESNRLRFERHTHSSPSHHVGSCDEGCRQGLRPHGHRAG